VRPKLEARLGISPQEANDALTYGQVTENPGITLAGLDEPKAEALVRLLSLCKPLMYDGGAENIWRVSYHPIICSAVILEFMNGQQGIRDEQLVARYDPIPALYPPYIANKERRESPNGRKVYVRAYSKEILDDGTQYRIAVGPADYHWMLNVQDSIRLLRRHVAEAANPIEFPFSFPGVLHTDCAVITSDNKLLIRKRSDGCRSGSGLWCVMRKGPDPHLDCAENGQFHPVATVLRAASEQLHIPREDLSPECVRFLGWAFDLAYGTHHIGAAIWLPDPLDSQTILLRTLPSLGREGTIERFAAIDFTLDSCIYLIASFEYLLRPFQPTSSSTSATILALALHQFGFDDVYDRLSRFYKARIGRGPLY
jgi:hypothetical protein